MSSRSIRLVRALPATAVVFAVTVAASSCAGPPPPPSPRPTISVEASALLRIESFGGLMRRSEVFRHMPVAIVYANGVVIGQAPVDAIFPAPALPNLMLTRVDETGLGEIFDWLHEVGLRGPDRELGQAIPDGDVTIFTFTDGGTHTTKVHSQGMDPQIAALRQLRDALSNLPSSLPDGTFTGPTAYDFDRLAVLIIPPGMDEEMVPPGMRGVVEWPLLSLAELAAPQDPQEDYACFLISGPDLAELRPMLEQASELTLWASGVDRYQLAFRPLLPDEERCPRY